MWLMPIRHLGSPDARLDQLSHIERLLEEYRATKDPQLLRLAIELWDEAQAAYHVPTGTNRAAQTN
jgi:hypothetical protein